MPLHGCCNIQVLILCFLSSSQDFPPMQSVCLAPALTIGLHNVGGPHLIS